MEESMSDVFLSYARGDDEAFVKRLHKDLTSRGFDVWWDRVSMPSRALTFLQEVRDAVDKASRLVIVIGPNAVKSDYVRAEWKHALNFSKVVIPILRQGGYERLPEELSRLHSPDFRARRGYDEALTELLRILAVPVQPLATLFDVPALPPHLNRRTEDVEYLTALVLADVTRATVITSSTQTITLQGMGGVGKSVLATIFARDAGTRRAFRDGVIWLTLGQRPNLVQQLALCGQFLNDDPHEYLTLTRARARVQEVLARKGCLLVLDDVWDMAHVAPFWNALGERSRLLITTRIGSLANGLGAQEQRLDLLPDDAAVKLMADWAGLPVGSLPATAWEVAEECGNLPLALAITGAMMRGKLKRWDSVLERLRNADLEMIEQEFPGYPYKNLLRAIQVSVDSLDSALHDRYLDFAVFPNAVLIPESVLVTLWKPQGLDKADAQDAMDSLVGSSLVTRDDGGRLRLHDLQYDYVRKQAPDLAALHARLLQAYASGCCDWHTGPSDGYFFEHLAYHLVQAGQQNELRRLLLNFSWLQAKLAATNVNSLIADFDLLPRNASTWTVRGALLAASDILIRDPGQLGGQLAGRLATSAGDEVRTLLQQVSQTVTRPRLRPTTVSLAPPRECLLHILRGHTGMISDVAMIAGGRQLLSASTDGTFKVWDLERREAVRTLGVPCFKPRWPARRWYDWWHYVQACSIVLTPDGHHAFCGYVFPGGIALQLVEVEEARVICTPRMRRLWRRLCVFSLALSPNLRALLAGLDDGCITVWDLSGAVVRTLIGPKSMIQRIAVSPNGSRAISGSRDGTLVVWDLERGSVVHVLKGHTDGITTVIITPDGRQALSGSGSGCINLWDLQDGRVVHTFKSGTGAVYEIALTVDGLQAVSASVGGTLTLWDLQRGRLVHTVLTNGEISGIALVGDGRCALSIGDDIWLCDLKT
jgi:hypothetical protein